MNLFKKERVFILFAERTIRYLAWSDNKSNQVSDYGEIILDAPIFYEGKFMNPNLLSSVLSNLINHKKWKRKKLSFIVPDRFVVMRHESIPSQLGFDEIKTYIKLHLEGSIRLPLKDPYLDFHLLKEGEEKNEILIFAYPIDHLKPIYQLFDQSALEPQVADVSYLSIYRAYLEADLASADEHLLMIQWNHYDLSLTVFHQQIPKFTRHIQIPAASDGWQKNDDERELVWELSMTTLPELIDEQLLSIERVMDFYQYSITHGEGQINQILLTGDFPDQALLEEKLQERFVIPIKTIDLPNQLPGKYASLYGLGLRGK